MTWVSVGLCIAVLLFLCWRNAIVQFERRERKYRRWQEEQDKKRR